MERLSDALAVLRRAVLRRRRLIALLLIAVGVLAGLRALAPPPAQTSLLVVAAHDLPAGAVVAAGDLATVRVPPGTAPHGVLEQPVGRLLAAPLRAGEPVTDVRVVGAGLAEPSAGTTAVPVRLSDAGQAALLTSGDTIDLMATDPASGDTRALATKVTVLAVPQKEAASDGALPGRLVVLGVPSMQVGQVTGAAVSSFVTYVWARH